MSPFCRWPPVCTLPSPRRVFRSKPGVNSTPISSAHRDICKLARVIGCAVWFQTFHLVPLSLHRLCPVNWVGGPDDHLDGTAPCPFLLCTCHTPWPHLPLGGSPLTLHPSPWLWSEASTQRTPALALRVHRAHHMWVQGKRYMCNVACTCCYHTCNIACIHRYHTCNVVCLCQYHIATLQHTWIYL